MQFAPMKKMRPLMQSMTCLLVLVFIMAPNVLAQVPGVQIASAPLFGGRGSVHPNMLLSLSVEYPTVGVAYRGDQGTYNREYEYVGYFNPLKCYRYVGGNRNIVNGYFAIVKDADVATHECGGETFSGNFMNWVASSSIDMLRYALTGGDRVIDSEAVTILQRAVLPPDFYANASHFPRRTVTAGGNVSAPGQVTPFNVNTLYVVSCSSRILFSETKSGPANCDAGAFDGNGGLLETDKKLGEYLVRVQVCDDTEGPVRSDLCQRYASHYKPVGEMQRHADKIRFAAMGYLLDGAVTRYGGVLRAPMKYVGPRKFQEPSFTEVANDNLEWDATTGVFYTNPDNPTDRASTSVKSGVINYLNQFGRLGTYKSKDPVSELYFEGIRYFQGQQPTPEATDKMSEAMKEGFPVVQNWTDPVTAACQKNYIVSIADANTHWDRYVPGNQRTTYASGLNANDPVRSVDAAVTGVTPELDVKLWTRKVGDMEADLGKLYFNPSPRTRLAGLETQDTGSNSEGTYYMAGLAYWANTNDIRLDKRVRVKTFSIDVDEGGNGLVDGSPRALKPRDSQLYLAAKYGGFEDRNNDGNPFVTTAGDGGLPVTGSNLEWDGDGNGVPDNYFLAGQPKEFIQSIRRIFAKVTNVSGTIGSVAASSTKVSSDGVFVYQPGFDASRWSGTLKKQKLTWNEQSGALNIASGAEWDAGDVLTGANGQAGAPNPADRNIYTAKIETGRLQSMVEFKWENLTDGQKALLDTSPVDGKTDGLGSQRLDYLRGVRNQEVGQLDGIFRARDRILGDIINSNAVYVGAPALNVQGPGYQKFYTDNQSRTKVVYVGANDGMLHAFDAANGRELFSYIPNALIPTLNQLTSPDYVHRSYVDGTINVTEARLGSGSGAEWKTILTSGMGGGAQGVFALDVTHPSDFRRGKGVLWEFTDSDDADMGNLIGAPTIAKFKTKVVDGIPEFKYFAVIPSGLNNYMNDGENRFNPAAPATLFLLSLDKAPSVPWKAGENYYKFPLPIQNTTLQNGLSSPALVTGNDGAVRYAYAGDLQGNLWRLNFTSFPGTTPKTPLFTATDSQGTPQPITSQPKVVFAPGGGYVVLFGTGKFIEDADVTTGNFKTQSFYGIYDNTRDDGRVSGREQLASRTLNKSGDTLIVTGSAFTYGTSADNKRGWYVDFVDSDKTGERIVTNPLVAYGRLFFNTVIPGGNPCVIGGGGRSYAVDTLTGMPIGDSSTGFLSQVGLLSAPVLFETGNAAVGDRDATGGRWVNKKYAVFNFGTGGVKGLAALAQNGVGNLQLAAGRFSWREILNWLELRAAANTK